jgi:YVTN family beta-propeller protein
MADDALFYRTIKLGPRRWLFYLLFIAAISAVASSSGLYASENVYVANSFKTIPPSHPSTVTMLNGSTLSIMKNVTVGYNAHYLAASPDGSNLWVTCRGSNDIYVIDAVNFEIIKKISLEDVLVTPVGIAFMPNDNLVYVAFESIGKVGIFDAKTHDYVSSVSVGGNPAYIVFTPDGLKAYVVDFTNSIVKVIRTSDNAVIATVLLRGHRLQDAVISPNGNYVYLSNQDQNQIEVIRTKDDANIVPISTNNLRPQAIGISPDGAYLFIGFIEGEVDMLRLSDDSVVSSQKILGTGNGWCIAVRPDGSRIFVSDRDKSKCFAFDVIGENLTYVAVTDMDSTPHSRAFPNGLTIIEKPISYGLQANKSRLEINKSQSVEIEKKVGSSTVPGFGAFVSIAALVLMSRWIWRRI